MSDGVVAGTRDDGSGRALVERLTEAGFAVDEHRVVADGVESVRDALTAMSEGFAGLIMTTGGTGFGPRDLTPEGTVPRSSAKRPGSPKPCASSPTVTGGASACCRAGSPGAGRGADRERAGQPRRGARRLHGHRARRRPRPRPPRRRPPPLTGMSSRRPTRAGRGDRSGPGATEERHGRAGNSQRSRKRPPRNRTCFNFAPSLVIWAGEGRRSHGHGDRRRGTVTAHHRAESVGGLCHRPRRNAPGHRGHGRRSGLAPCRTSRPRGITTRHRRSRRHGLRHARAVRSPRHHAAVCRRAHRSRRGARGRGHRGPRPPCGRQGHGAAAGRRYRRGVRRGRRSRHPAARALFGAPAHRPRELRGEVRELDRRAGRCRRRLVALDHRRAGACQRAIVARRRPSRRRRCRHRGRRSASPHGARAPRG